MPSLVGSEMCIRDSHGGSAATLHRHARPLAAVSHHAWPSFFFQAEDGIRDRSPSRGLGDVYKRQIQGVEAIWS